MRSEERTIYRCDFCPKYLLRKPSMEFHEVDCHGNPDNKRVCIGCDHLKKVERDLYFDTFHGEGKRTIEILYCSKINSYLYPPKVERKGNAINWDDIGGGTVENQPMFIKCKHFKDPYE